MIILYISHLDGSIANGLSWSVPASIKAQEQLDNVLWVNTSKEELPHWRETLAYTKSGRLVNLYNIEEPFNHPDVVVFEGFYDDLNDVLLGRWLKKHGIPYIVIPRSALTIQAMNNHSKTKKRVAHWLFYNRFIKDALAIQCLTQKEYNDTKVLFDNRYFVIPNGIYQPSITKNYMVKDYIKAIFIGRIDIHQKGLDVLLCAIEQDRELLRTHNFSLDVYGPNKQDFDIIQKIIIQKKIGDIVVLKGETKGEAKKQALLESDVFFLTSRFEGHPMGLIEALAYGLPCFITPGTNMAEVVEQYGCGWVSDFSVECLSEKLKQMIGQKEDFEKFGKKSKELSHIYAWDKLAEKFHEEVEILLSGTQK